MCFVNNSIINVHDDVNIVNGSIPLFNSNISIKRKLIQVENLAISVNTILSILKCRSYEITNKNDKNGIYSL